MFLLGVLLGGVVTGATGFWLHVRLEKIRQKRYNHARRLRTPKKLR
jgi:hypothetical protein